MIKKKYLVILFSLLLVALLGTFSSCYADSFRTWTSSDIKNFLYNHYKNNDYVESNITSFIEAQESNIDLIVTSLNDNDKVVALGNANNVNFFVNNNSNTYFYQSSNNNIYSTGTTGKNTRYSFNISGSGSFNTVTGANANTMYVGESLYTGATIYTNSSHDVVKYSPGYYTPENIFDSYYSDIVWEFSPTSNSQTVTINGGNQWQYHAITGGWDIYLGSITDSEWVDKIQYRVGYWNNSLNQFSPVSSNTYTIYDYAKNGPLYKYWSSTNNGNTYTTGIYLDTYKYQNCILQLVITSEIPNELTTIYYDYLITNSKTYITGGIFYPTLTFSGDYLNDYNNQEQVNTNEKNNDDLINTLTDSSYSGDITLPTIEIEDPTGDFFTWLYTSFVSVLNNNSNTYIDIPIWKTNYRIYSNVFMLPNGLLRDFISARLVAYSWFTIFKVY